jgi:3-deoxy-manno-octulosonate cytidylyltransferase (CMP-KDO synthetase)
LVIFQDMAYNLSKMKATIVIPARLASSRLPRKVLADIAGKPLVQHVYERATKAAAHQVLVATDSEEVRRTVEEFGGTAILTDPDLPSGTARIASIIDRISSEIIVNVQGDQPLVEPDLIAQIIKTFSDTPADIVTPVWRITDNTDLVDPGIAKVVRGHDGQALYFSRSPIPYVRDIPVSDWLQKTVFWGHYGIYGYRRQVLVDFKTSIPPGPLEEAEKLEQLRFLESGYSIYTVETGYRQVAVDTAEDLARVRRMMTPAK